MEHEYKIDLDQQREHRCTSDGRYFPIPKRKDCCDEHQPEPVMSCRFCGMKLADYLKTRRG